MATATRQRSKKHPLTEAVRLKEIASYIGLCFMAMTEGDEPDFKDIANRTQLSLSTVYRLHNGQFSLAMRVKTLQALAYATGFRLELTETGSRMYLVK